MVQTWKRKSDQNLATLVAARIASNTAKRDVEDASKVVMREYLLALSLPPPPNAASKRGRRKKGEALITSTKRARGLSVTEALARKSRELFIWRQPGELEGHASA
jgi:hypothetical protein